MLHSVDRLEGQNSLYTLGRWQTFVAFSEFRICGASVSSDCMFSVVALASVFEPDHVDFKIRAVRAVRPSGSC